MEPKTHYTAKELADLPGMPASLKGVLQKATRENWPSQPRAGRGGGREYPLASLPKETREHLLNAMIDSLPEKICNLPAVRQTTVIAEIPQPELPDLGSLKQWQTKTMDARLVFLRLIDRAVAEGYSVDGAIQKLVSKSMYGELGELQPLVAIANKRSGTDTKKRALSGRTLYRWRSDLKKANGNYAVLAPKGIEKTELPAWAPHFLKAYRIPQPITPAEALEEMKKTMPAGVPIPSIHQVRRFMDKFSKLDIQRGRKTGAELRAQRSYVERDLSEFLPGDIALCDGHSFKAKVAHPVHQRPFKPEVCAVKDAVTRVVWGWAAGLAESTFTVADAIRDAVTPREGKPACIPAILYTDNGSGNIAEANSDEITGLFPRLGITFKTGRAGNPQGRGSIEKLQDSLWIRAAKKLPTYMGRGMDKQTARSVYLTLDKDVRTAKKTGNLVKSELLMTWAEFLEFADAEVNEYNRRPHSALPKIRDPQTGLKRHMCPLECLASFIEQGWRPTLPETGELDHLFRPQVQVKARRGRVVVFGNWYHNADLEHYQGQLVNVSYDIHDPATVQVRDWEQRLICTAKFEGNKRSFYAVPVVEKAREDRRKNRTKTLERHLEEVQLEAQTIIQTEAMPIVSQLPQGMLERTEQIIQRVERKKKLIGSAWERYEDILEREKGEGISDYEQQWKQDYERFTETGKRVGIFKKDEYCNGGIADEAIAK
jgi:putative transposase